MPGEIDYNLNRFMDAQNGVYERALSELKAGRKRSHWMWFIFPQIAGLGSSFMAEKYAIRSAEEASAYLADPILGSRLFRCVDAVLGIEGRSVHKIFGSPDDLKLRSSMTLFAAVSEHGSPFHKVIDLFYRGEFDERTIQLLDASN
ncbi:MULTISPECIES: DUF1810 domain-containing protein [Rhizobium]|uniref:Calpastatin n=1 Tax=Rhizobium favelukesii TaxID=348824 RepID=W6RWG1_9HYPH|nr:MULTISPECIES: DUF1810 domain-containing protein [Rhizobium]MCS0462694.1 DUF1810 domain-containing protein [Rhizobium favelukesii]UFS79376.1 DUF1810 domain-containing protein [Rhizobium sp. T136]CDM62928.1 hypothetical protein LPU83_pLPU83d_1558 [Rhizobium favelukesii]